MAGQGIFIDILARLNQASVAASLTKLTDQMNKAGTQMSRDWDVANASLKKTQDQLITTTNQVAALTAKRAQAETDVQAAQIRTAEVTQRVADQEMASLRALQDAEANLASVEASRHDAKIAQIRAEAALLDDNLVKQDALLARADKLAAADAAALSRATNRRNTAADTVARDNNAPVLGAIAAEDVKRQQLANTINAQGDAQMAAAGAADAHSAAMDRSTESVSNTGRAVNILGYGLTTLVAGGMYESGKQAANFQERMNRITAATGESQEGIKTLSDGIMGLAQQTGYSLTQLSDASFMVEKAGFRGSKAVDVLTASSQLARAEHADLTTVVSGLTTSMTDYNVSTDKAIANASKLREAAGLAKTPLDQYTGALHNIEPIAAKMANVPQEQILGILSQVTQSGMSPERATQNMAAMLRNLTSTNNGNRDDALRAIKLDPDQVARDLNDPTKGLMPVLQEIQNSINSMKTSGGMVALSSVYDDPGTKKRLNDMMPLLHSDKAKELLQDTMSGQLASTGRDFRTAISNVQNSGDPLAGEDVDKLMQIAPMVQKQEGLARILKKNRDPNQTQEQIYSSIFGQESMNVASQVIGSPEAWAQTQGKVSDIGNASGDPDGTVKGFDDAMKGVNLSFDQLKGTVGTLEKELGDAMLPGLKDVATVMKDGFGFLANHPDLSRALGDGLAGLAGIFLAMKAYQGILKPAYQAGATGVNKARDFVYNEPVSKVTDYNARLEDGSIRAAEDVQIGGAAAGTSLKTGGATAGDTLKTGATTASGELKAGGTKAAGELGSGAATAAAELKTSAAGFRGGLSAMLGGLGSKLGMAGMLASGFLPTGDNNAPEMANNAAMMSWMLGPEVGAPVTAGVAAYDYLVPDSVKNQAKQIHQDTGNQADQGNWWDKVSHFMTGFAGGGVLPGYSPGQDNLLGMVGGKPVGLSGGEGIIVPEAVRALGGAAGINALNAAHTKRRPGKGGFAGGGVMNALAGGLTDVLLNQWGLPPGSDPWAQASAMGGGGSNSLLTMFRPGGSLSGSGGGGGSVDQWVDEAMRITGVPESWRAGIKTIIGRESSGNPNAINNWDSNAAKGQPSQGLMQVIPSTFSRYGMQGLGGITNPVANIVAAIRYIQAQYGDISGVQQANPNMPPKGYKDGGVTGDQAGYGLGSNPNGTNLTGGSGNDMLAAMGLPPLPGNDEAGAQIDTIMAARAVHAAFPGVSSFGLYRSPDGFNEHSSGEAADAMIPDWQSATGKAMGDQIKDFALANAEQYGIEYVLWRQRQWMPDGSSSPMSDRGSPTQNHMDHVHIRTAGGGFPQGGGPGAQGVGSLPSGTKSTPGSGGLPSGMTSLTSGGSPGGGGSPSGMSSGMPGMSGLSSSGGLGPGMDNPLQAAASGGFSMANIVRLLTTFLAEMALGNPLGKIMAGQAGGSQNVGTQGYPPTSPMFGQTLNANTDALSNFNQVQGEQVINSDKLANAQGRVQSAYAAMLKHPGDVGAQNRYQASLRDLRDTGIRQDISADKSAAAFGSDEQRLGDLTGTRDSQQKKLDALKGKDPLLLKPGEIDAATRALGKTDEAIDKINRKASTDKGKAGLDDPNLLIPGAGQGMPFKRGMGNIKMDVRTDPGSGGSGYSPTQPYPGSVPGVAPYPGMPGFGGLGGAPGATMANARARSGGAGLFGAAGRMPIGDYPGSNVAAAMPGSTAPGGNVAAAGARSTSQDSSRQGTREGPGFGITGTGIIGAAETMGSLGLGAVSGGAGAIAGAAGAAGGGGGGGGGGGMMALANRTAGFIGQLGAIAAMAPLETFLPNDSSIGDPTKSWFGKIAGGLAGAHSSGPNVAGMGGPPTPPPPAPPGGDSAPPLKPKQGDANDAKGGQQQNVGQQINGDVHYHNTDNGQVASEVNRGMLAAAPGSPI